MGKEMAKKFHAAYDEVLAARADGVRKARLSRGDDC